MWLRSVGTRAEWDERTKTCQMASHRRQDHSQSPDYNLKSTNRSVCVATEDNMAICFHHSPVMASIKRDCEESERRPTQAYCCQLMTVERNQFLCLGP